MIYQNNVIILSSNQRVITKCYTLENWHKYKNND